MKAVGNLEDLEAYRPVVEHILNWMEDWLHQDVFDAKVLAEKPLSNNPKFMPYKRDTPLLDGYLFQSELKGCIQLLQMLIYKGFVEYRAEPDGKIAYRRTL